MRDKEKHTRHSAPAPVFARVGLVLWLGVLCVGCTSNKPAEVVDANTFPTNYRDQISTFLMTQLTNSADFHNAMVSQPVLKPFGQNSHYVACVLLNGRNQHKEKAVIYFAGNINQFVDATPDECSGVDYQPFPELAKVAPK